MTNSPDRGSRVADLAHAISRLGDDEMQGLPDGRYVVMSYNDDVSGYFIVDNGEAREDMIEFNDDNERVARALKLAEQAVDRFLS